MLWLVLLIAARDPGRAVTGPALPCAFLDIKGAKLSGGHLGLTRKNNPTNVACRESKGNALKDA